MNAKKQIELHLFNRFVELARLSTVGFATPEQPNPPEPDIVVRSDGKIIGIEIRRYCKTRSLKQQESEEDSIVEIARRRYESFGCPALYVSVQWAIGHRLAKWDREPLSQALADTVRTNIPSLGGATKGDWATLAEPLLSAVHHLHINRRINYRQNCWHPMRSGWVVDAEPREIQAIIEVKDQKYLDYRGKCDDLWLLIAVESWSPASWCEVTERLQSVVYQTRFAKVYFLADFPRRVLKLRTCRPAT